MSDNTNKDIGLPAPQRPKTINYAQEKEILRLNHEGYNENQIAKITGIPRTSVNRCIQYLAQDPNNAVKDNRQQNLERSIRRKEKLERKVYHSQVRKQQQSDRRRKVLELNHEGLGPKAIAKELGIPKGTVFGDITYLSKDPENKVIREYVYEDRVNWKRIVRIIRDEYLPYYRSRGIKPTLRTVYYRLIAEGHITKSEAVNDRLSKYTVKARLGEDGYPQLPINCFADDTREVIPGHGGLDDEPTDPGDPTEPEDPDEYIDEMIEDLKNAPANWESEGEDGEPGEVGGHWYNQPEYVAVWEEKAALSSTFKSFLKDKHVDLVVNRGYSSLTFIYENCQELKPIVDKFGEDHVHILYFGDFDSSGTQIDEKIKEYFTIFGIPAAEKIFQRVAVTQDQIEEYGIQTKTVYYRENNGRFTKGENPNDNNFVTKYGDGQTADAADLDGFMAADDRAFEETVQDAVDQYYDEFFYDQMVEEYEDVVNEPTESYAADEETYRRRMYAKITEAFAPGWDVEYRDED